MNTYHIVCQPDGRVILIASPRLHDVVISTITAATWVEARAKVNEAAFYHFQGIGWFERGIGVYRRAA